MATTLSLDDAILRRDKGVRWYRRFMFWNRITSNIAMMSEGEEETQFVEAIFGFSKNPESGLMLRLVKEHIINADPETHEASWHAIFSKVPFVFLASAQRLILMFEGGLSPGELSARMDGLYGLDWVLDNLSDVLHSDGVHAELDEVISITRMAFHYLLPAVLPLLKAPAGDLNAIPADIQEQLGRERRVALEVLAALLKSSSHIGFELEVSDETYDYIAVHTDLYYPESRWVFLTAPKGSSQAAANVDSVLLNEAIQSANSLAALPLYELLPSEEAKHSFAGEARDFIVKDDGSCFVRYWVPQADGSTEERYARCDEDSIAELCETLNRIAKFTASNPALAQPVRDMGAKLKELIAFPVVSCIRMRASAVLLNAFREELGANLDFVWRASLEGPRAVNALCDIRLAVLVSQTILSVGIETEQVKLPQVLDKLLMDGSSSYALYSARKTILADLSGEIMESDVGDLRSMLLQCIPVIANAVKAMEIDFLVYIDNVLTDFVKRGGDQLAVYANAITESYLNMLPRTGKVALYGLSLWLGKCVEGNFVDNEAIAKMATECAALATTILRSDQDEDAVMSVPVYAITRVIMYCHNTLPRLCGPLYSLLYANVPLPSAASGDLIAQTANSRAAQILRIVPKSSPELEILMDKFVRSVLHNSDAGLVGPQELAFLERWASEQEKMSSDASSVLQTP